MLPATPRPFARVPFPAWILLLAGWVLLLACEDEDPEGATFAITALVGQPAQVVTGGRIQLQAQVQAPAGDSLVYDWACSRGVITAGSEPGTGLWQAPAAAGSCRITLTVTGPRGTAQATLDQEVQGSPGSLEMVAVPAGSFTMGRTGVGGVEHPVTLSHTYQLSRTEVTNQQFLDALNWAHSQGLVSIQDGRVRQHNKDLLTIDYPYNLVEIRFDEGTQRFRLNMATSSGSAGPGLAYPQGYDPAEFPVIWVSWYGAACYCDWLSLMHGLEPFYRGEWNRDARDPSPYEAEGYRLPTEAEWEHGAQFPGRLYPWGGQPPSCDRANHKESGYCIPWTRPVGSHASGHSSLGLHDMAGNLWEWCHDVYTQADGNPATDPAGPAAGALRCLRGGSWFGPANELACAFRFANDPGTMDIVYGFRIARIQP